MSNEPSVPHGVGVDQNGDHKPRKRGSEGPRDKQEPKLTGRAAVGILGGLFLAILLRPLIPASWWPKGDHSWTDVILAAITLGYLIATISYVRVSNRQWRVLLSTRNEIQRSNRLTRRSLRISRDALRETRRANNLTLRAWVVIEDVELKEVCPPGLPTELIVAVAVRNVGRLPAVAVTVSLPPETIPKLAESPLVSHRDHGPEGVVIAPSEPKRYVFFIQNISAERLAALRADTLFLFVDARVTYTDALGGKRHKSTQEALYVRPKDGKAEYFHCENDGRTMT